MFPLAALTPLMARLKAHVLGVMLPLGDRVRQRPSNMGQHKLIPEKLVLVVQQWLQKRRQMIDALMERIAAGKHVGRAYKRREPRPDAVRKPRVEIPPEKRLPPRIFGWVWRMAPEIGWHAVELGRLAEEPEMRAMIEAAPQMARLWVPLLNGAGVERPDWWPQPQLRPGRSRRKLKPRDPRFLASAPDPVAAWQARIPLPPPPAPPAPATIPGGTLGIGWSAPSIPPVPLPWYMERLWPPDHPIWKRPAQAAPSAPPADPAPPRLRTPQEALNAAWVRLSTRRIGEI